MPVTARLALCLLLLGPWRVAAEEVPRPEVPQPQFARADWLTLNGTWEFEFDPGNAGLDEHWGAGTRAFSRRIVVPYAPETARSGIADTSFHPWVWYRRSVSLPASWAGRRVLLRFGAVDYRAMVWVNGQLAGEHEGGHTPFVFDITRHLGAGPLTIVVRAEDPPTDRSIPRGKQFWEEQSRGIFYRRTTGIWQPVWLEATGDSYLERLRTQTTPDGAVTFDARVARPADGLRLRARVRFATREVASGEASANGDRARLVLHVPSPQRWDSGRGSLYDVTLDLVGAGGTLLDRVESYFGYRTITVEQGRVFLNGHPLYLKMVLDQGYWPDAGLTPPTDQAIQDDIRLARAMGFNGARTHQKVEDPRFLYWADKAGFLVSGEMANAYVYDEQYAARFTREWMAALERDASHPSVVMWVPVNESWGTPDLHDPRQRAHLAALYHLTKSFDPDRIVIGNDGWEQVGTTDLFTLHDYAATGAALLEKYTDLGRPGVPIPPNGRAALAPGASYNGTPFALTEFGGIAFIAPGSRVPKDAWGYAGVEPDGQAALGRLRGLYEALARLPAFVGICYTQLTDVEQEINGLLTFDRVPKFDPAAIKALNDMLRP
jgi:beta-galactosidase/beta-glucuronidase